METSAKTAANVDEVCILYEEFVSYVFITFRHFWRLQRESMRK